MKTALCISGVPRGDYKQNVQKLKEYFDCPVFLATWKGNEVEDTCFYFDEPEMEYNPGFQFECKAPVNYSNKGEDRRAMSNPKLWLHRTKQILIHDKLLQNISKDYDMIIRARFDTKINHEQFRSTIEATIEYCYDSNKSAGFCTPKNGPQNVLNQMKRLPDVHNRTTQYHLDHLIFHRRDMWDHHLVNRLHRQKKLIAAEYGWYQILSEPFTDDIYKPNHLSFIGFAGIQQ